MLRDLASFEGGLVPLADAAGWRAAHGQVHWNADWGQFAADCAESRPVPHVPDFAGIAARIAFDLAELAVPRVLAVAPVRLKCSLGDAGAHFSMFHLSFFRRRGALARRSRLYNGSFPSRAGGCRLGRTGLNRRLLGRQHPMHPRVYDSESARATHWFYWRVDQEAESQHYGGNVATAYGNLAWSTPHWVTFQP
jgi:hypothetical protein